MHRVGKIFILVLLSYFCFQPPIIQLGQVCKTCKILHDMVINNIAFAEACQNLTPSTQTTYCYGTYIFKFCKLGS